MKSAKSELHEHLQRHQLPPATFKCLPAAGVSGGFTCDVTIIGSSSGARTFSSQNCHPKKKQAEDDVARVALGELVPVAEKPELGQPVALAATAGATEMSAAASNKEPPTAAEAAPSAMQNPPFIREGAVTAVQRMYHVLMEAKISPEASLCYAKTMVDDGCDTIDALKDAELVTEEQIKDWGFKPFHQKALWKWLKQL